MLFSLCLLGASTLAYHGAAAHKVTVDSRREYKQYKENTLNQLREYAEKNDYYFHRTTLPNLAVNQNFYGDGSLRRDPNTGITYKKGLYYADSRGNTADYGKSETAKRPC